MARVVRSSPPLFFTANSAGIVDPAPQAVNGVMTPFFSEKHSKQDCPVYVDQPCKSRDAGDPGCARAPLEPFSTSGAQSF